MKNNFIISLLVFSVLTIVTSCNTVKNVPANKYLLKKNTIYINNKRNVDTNISAYLIQRPNQQVFKIPIPLHFYNLGNQNFEKTYEEWVKKHPKTYNFIKKTFTNKQALGIGNWYKGIHKWFLTKGEKPVILNTTKTKLSAKKLQKHFFNQGYFDATVTYAEEPLERKKRAKVNYYVNTNEPYFLDTISQNIASKVVDSIYESQKESSFIKHGEQFKLENFELEAKRLTSLFRNSGIYHFSENLIGFNEIDSAATNHKTNVVLNISDRLTDKDNVIKTHPLKIQKVTKVGIFTDYTYNRKDEPYLDTAQYKGYTFFAHDKLRFKPKALTNAIFIEPNKIYKDSDRNMSRIHLKALQNFKLVKIRYDEINENELAASIILTPLKKYSTAFNTEITHSNIKKYGLSGKFSLLNRNTFKGAEIFKLSFLGSFFNTSTDLADSESFFNAWELGIDASLEVPRFLLPFNTSKLIPKKMSPKTVLSIGSSLQKNIGLDKQKFTGIFDLTWQSKKTIRHEVELLKAQYIKNLNIGSYFNIYSSEFNKLQEIKDTHFPTVELTTNNAIPFIKNNIDEGFLSSNPLEYQIAKNIEKRHNIITTNNIIPTLSYSFTYNGQTDFKDNNFFFFKGRIATSGNLTTAFSKKTNDGSPKTLFDIPIAQYVRTDLEYKKFWETSSSSVMAFRSFLGVAIPYGNSTELPFSKSYFIGGANDLRAWRIYDLGPGSSNTGLEFNVGSFKFITSLEYRFKIINSIKGALFMDAGNIWDLTKSTLTSSEAKFKGLSSIKDIAIGSGFGLRYDFSFLVLRLDLGFKTYEPYLSSDGKWFKNYNFNNAVYNVGINYPF